MAPRVISVMNYKGGVGKTTVTANLGAELAWAGHKVLLVDLDPQCSLTFSFMAPEVWSTDLERAGTIKKWYDAVIRSEDIELSSLVTVPDATRRRLRGHSAGSLSLLPSHLGLINVDLELATQLAGSTMRQAKANYLRVHNRLADGLREEAFADYDVVLIDCPPNFNIVTKTAIVASEAVLIPAKPDYLSTLGIDYLIRSLNELISDFNDYAAEGDAPGAISPQILGVLFTMVQIYGGAPISAHRTYIAQTRALEVPVFDTHIRENKTLFSAAPAQGVPVVLDRDDYRGLRSELETATEEFRTRLSM